MSYIKSFETLEMKISQEGYNSPVGKAFGNLVAAIEQYESVMEGSGMYSRNPERPAKIERMTTHFGWAIYNLSGKIKKTEGYRLIKWIDEATDEVMYELGKEVLDYFYG